MKLSDSHKISQEKRDFKISDVLITAWSRVQVLAGPYKKEARRFRPSCFFFCMPTAYWQSVQKLYSGKHPADDFSSYGQCTRSDCKHRKRHFPAFQSWICSLLSNVRQRRALTAEIPLPKKGRSTERPFDRLCLPEHCHDIGGAVVVDEGRAQFAVTGRVIQQLCRRAVQRERHRYILRDTIAPGPV